MKGIRATARALAVVFCLAGFAASALLGKLLLRGEGRRKRFFIRNIGFWTRIGLVALNVRLEVIGRDERFRPGKNYLLVSNHLSYLDILVTSAVKECLFVTSVDLGQTGFYGTVAELGGSVFVERRKPRGVARDIRRVAEELKAGFDVLLYPEGTSSNGRELLPFKRGLFLSAGQAQRDIIPVCIRYTEIDGASFGAENADLVCWHGNMNFLKHVSKVLTLDSVKVELTFHETVPSAPTEPGGLASRCREIIAASYFRASPAARSHPTASSAPRDLSPGRAS
jgi:lyso-ornithine lipid O-acyltransferase